MRRRAINSKIKDLILAGGLMGVGLVAFLTIITTEEQTRIEGADALTFATLPMIYSGLLMALVGLFAANTLRSLLVERRAVPGKKTETAPNDDDESDRIAPATIAFRTLATLAVLVIYVVLLEYVDFLILTTLFLAVMFVVYGQRSVTRIAVVSLLGGAGFYGLFIHLLHLPI
jgi:hypothetical protein